MATYRTKQGDTWDKIALSELGDEFMVDKLMAANQKHLDILIFSEGTILTIPEITDDTYITDDYPEWRLDDDATEALADDTEDDDDLEDDDDDMEEED